MKQTEPGMFRRLNEELDKLGWTGADIAGELRCNRSTVSHWRTGTNFPTPIYLRDLYELGCDITYIITGEATQP